MSYLTKHEKKEYEQIRRKQIIQDARDHRLMLQWLTKVHPDTVAQFSAFEAKLQRENPLRKDLTRAPAFRKFMQEGNDAVVKREKLIVALVDVLQPSVQSQRDLSPQTTAESVVPLNPIQSQQESFTQTVVGPTVSLNENPFNLTNEEIDELLAGLDEIGYEGVRALGGTDNGCSEGCSVPQYIDSELASVLDMDVGDFIV